MLLVEDRWRAGNCTRAVCGEKKIKFARVAQRYKLVKNKRFTKGYPGVPQDTLGTPGYALGWDAPPAGTPYEACLDGGVGGRGVAANLRAPGSPMGIKQNQFSEHIKSTWEGRNRQNEGRIRIQRGTNIDVFRSDL